MMRIDILTLFPQMFDSILNQSILKRAQAKKLVKINILNFRDFATSNNSQVDDTPYGGGAGMVLMCQPIVDALNAIKTPNSHIVLLTPCGKLFNQGQAQRLSKYEHLILICGHYEGFDERILNFVDEQISIGDYILTGGEIPAMVIVDSCIRLIDGVITQNSLEAESFNENLLDYPVYTKPQNFRGLEVPSVLLSGNHQAIAEYRLEQRLKKTQDNRPDLLEK